MAFAGSIPSAAHLIPSDSIAQLEARRSAALTAFAAAFDSLATASALYGDIVEGGPRGPSFAFGSGRYADEYGFGKRADFLARVQKEIDADAWAHLIDRTQLERFMDRKARDEFRAQIRDEPPEATADNIRATLEQFVSQADLIFKRGIALAFSGLDRRFRSHDGFKVGDRIVLARAFTDHGAWNHYSAHDETLRDVERAFYLLDGKPHPERGAGIVGLVDVQRRGFGPHAFTVEDDLFRVRVFLNGNAHVWFKRADLVEKVNLLLASYYGEVVGDGRAQDRRHEEPNRTPAKNFGFFETPEAVGSRVIEEARIREGQSVLEPQAGLGAIALLAQDSGARVTCVEIQQQLAHQLRRAGFAAVHHADFFDMSPERIGLFDAVVMNPPFDGQRDIDHVRHALRFVRPGGRLVAVMSAGIEFRSNRRAVEFRALIDQLGGAWRDLPAGSFAASGTNVNTVLLTLCVPNVRASA